MENNITMYEILVNYLVNTLSKFELDFMNCVVKIWKEFDIIMELKKFRINYLKDNYKYEDYKNISIIENFSNENYFLEIVDLCYYYISETLMELKIAEKHKNESYFYFDRLFDILDKHLKEIYLFVDFSNEVGSIPYGNFENGDEILTELKLLQYEIIKLHDFTDNYYGKKELKMEDIENIAMPKDVEELLNNENRKESNS